MPKRWRRAWRRSIRRHAHWRSCMTLAEACRGFCRPFAKASNGSSALCGAWTAVPARCVSWKAGTRRAGNSPNSRRLAGGLLLRPASACPGASGPPGSRPGLPTCQRTPTFPRAPIAVKEGLRSGFCFPIVFAGDVLGVLEFFSREIRHPDQPSARDAVYRRQPDRPIHGAQTSREGAGSVLRPLARTFLYCRLRRVFQAAQSGVAGDPWVLLRMNSLAKPYLDFVHPEDRRRHRGRSRQTDGRGLTRFLSKIGISAKMVPTSGCSGPQAPSKRRSRYTRARATSPRASGRRRS